MNDYYTLKFLQDFVKDTEVRKGHIDDDIKTKLMLLMEESGELAKALRVHQNMRTHAKTEKHNLSDEFGDVFFIVVALANRSGIDLSEALLQKIAKDESKIYSKSKVD